jgi:hypothetical protein
MHKKSKVEVRLARIHLGIFWRSARVENYKVEVPDMAVTTNSQSGWTSRELWNLQDQDPLFVYRNGRRDPSRVSKFLASTPRQIPARRSGSPPYTVELYLSSSTLRSNGEQLCFRPSVNSIALEGVICVSAIGPVELSQLDTGSFANHGQLRHVIQRYICTSWSSIACALRMRNPPAYESLGTPGCRGAR